MEPLFLDVWDVVRIHRDQVQRYGGDPGIRDAGLLASATAMARAGTAEGYLHGDLIGMAAAYLFHVVRDHPFVDGNKRTGAVAAIVFLHLNGLRLEAREADLETLVRHVAEGSAGKDEVTEFLRGSVQPA
jgi:death-on-curing protein